MINLQEVCMISREKITEKNKMMEKPGFIYIGKREAAKGGDYNVDQYYRDALRVTTEKKAKTPRAPKQLQFHDFQFFPKRYNELIEKEKYASDVKKII